MKILKGWGCGFSPIAVSCFQAVLCCFMGIVDGFCYK